MAASTNKKVLIQRFEKQNLYGYLNPSAFAGPSGVEFLNQTGSLIVLPYSEIKAVCFVKEFEEPDPAEKRVFANRPKNAGLWVRLLFRDHDCRDGLLQNDLVHLDPHGFLITPPDPASNTQRLYVPRLALTELVVLAVVGSAQRTAKPRTKPIPKDQLGLFE